MTLKLARRRLCRSPLRRGMTLIELLVALLLFDISLLSLVAMSAVAVRRVGDAGRRNRAAIAATNRLEWLEVQGCATASAGSLTLERGMTEDWRVVTLSGGQELIDSIRIVGHTSESLVVRTRRPCRTSR